MLLRSSLLAALCVLFAATAVGASVPLGVKHVGASRELGTVTIRVDLNQAWKSSILAPASTTQLRVLYDSNADGTPDYTGGIVYRDKALSEDIAGHGNKYEPVPVSRATTKGLKFTHAVDALYTKVKPRRTLRIAVVLRDGKRTDRLPVKGWIVVPEPR